MNNNLKKILQLAFPLACLVLAAPAFARHSLSEWKLPPVPTPRDNPQSAAKVELGRQLVFDLRLSKNESMSCASCHVPFVGGGGLTPRAFGHGGELGRWAPSWDNSGYYTSLFWDGRADSLEQQTGLLPGHMGPVSAPAEMGGTVEDAMARLNAVPEYKKEFHKVFGTDATPENTAKAIAAFERTLVSRNAPFQRYVRGNKHAINAAAKRGFELFRGKAMCITCHKPPILTDNLFHNIGVPQVGPLKTDDGRFAVTKNEADKGKFKTPSLYNSASFAFFMHDGAYSSLHDVLEHYNKGGDASDKNQDPLIQPLHLSKRDIADLEAFLKSLTDPMEDRLKAPKLP